MCDQYILYFFMRSVIAPKRIERFQYRFVSNVNVWVTQLTPIFPEFCVLIPICIKYLIGNPHLRKLWTNGVTNNKKIKQQNISMYHFNSVLILILMWHKSTERRRFTRTSQNTTSRLHMLRKLQTHWYRHIDSIYENSMVN